MNEDASEEDDGEDEDIDYVDENEEEGADDFQGYQQANPAPIANTSGAVSMKISIPFFSNPSAIKPPQPQL
jgi:hypothetical protein